MLEKVGLAVDQEAEALKALEHWQKVNQVEANPDLQAQLMANAWMYKDEEIPGNYMGSGREK